MTRLTDAFFPPLLDWYAQNRRSLPWRENPTPYRVWVSEIMLQQTRVEAVREYFARFMQALPDVAALAGAEEQVYLKLWQGLGYYSRVRNLHKAACEVCRRYGGALPADYDKLRALSGIGDYTAGAIASIAFDLPVPAVDGNVLRVVARLTADPAPINTPAYQKQVRKALLPLMPQSGSGTLNQALMELGATICLPNGAPRCEVCPILGYCAAAATGQANLLPYRTAKKPRRVEQRTVLLLRVGEHICLRKRPKKGLLAGLWELPSFDGHLSADAVCQRLAGEGLSVLAIFSLAPAKHIFTHIEWQMIGYQLTLDRPPADMVAVTPAQLAESHAVPSAFSAFLSVL